MKDRAEEEKHRPADITGCLHVLHAAILASVSPKVARDGGLRITVHAHLGSGNGLIQLVDYVGDVGGPGRRKMAESGVVGAAFKSGGEPVVMSRPMNQSFEEYRAAMVRDWGMSEAEAAELRRDRYSFLAVPLEASDGRTVAAVYVDAKTPELFTQKLTNVITQACGGLVRFLRVRYGA